MIQETTTHVCHVCKSTHIVKNEKNRCRNAQYHCKNCGAYRVLKPKQVYSETEQQPVRRACLERCNLRGIARIFAMTRQTIARWFKAYAQSLPHVPETLLPATPDDVLELDAHLELCPEKGANPLGMDGNVSSNAADRGICHRGPEENNLSPPLANHSRRIPALPYLQ